MYGCVFAHILAPVLWSVYGDLRVIYRKELALSFCPVGGGIDLLSPSLPGTAFTSPAISLGQVR